MNRLIVVSNRLPFALDSIGADLWTVTPATGGLVSAIEPVLRERGGTWIGWPGTVGEIPAKPLAKATRNAGYKIVPVAFSETERNEFYYGYSNQVIWPLFHDLQNFCNFEPAYWQAYKEVNKHYADAIAWSARPDDFIWVHDYHLMYVAQALRERGLSRKLSGLTFFLHIPFPPYDIFSKLPQQQGLLRALLQFDLLGFQTRRDVRNFMQCVRRVMSDATVVPRRGLQLVRFEKREIRVVHIPIYHEFKDRIDRLVGDINGRFSSNTWLPVQYHFRSLDRDDLLAHYRACDIAFITPLKDGMNLVAKEYCACRTEQDGVLILSQFAGAAEQLKPDAMLVNPYDIEQMADTILQAFRMSEAERSARMKRMRRVVRNEDVFWWVDSFLKAGSKITGRLSQAARKRHVRLAR